MLILNKGTICGKWVYIMKEKFKMVSVMDSEYPDRLRLLGNKAPDKLWYAGDISLLNERCAAVVGSRKPSNYGRTIAFDTGRKLAEYGVVTVSGMAMGCDAEAHKGALKQGGKTAAVLGCGIDICYPKRNHELYENIIEKGLIISEFPPGTPPLPNNFPRRNRIISGLSELVIVVEAALSSGSLITAGFAAEQGRDVMAVPGCITNPLSLGCNKLIQDGVMPMTSIEDIIIALGIQLRDIAQADKIELGKDEEAVYNAVKINGEITSDLIAAAVGKSISEVNSIVGILEIKGFLLTSMGKISVAK